MRGLSIFLFILFFYTPVFSKAEEDVVKNTILNDSVKVDNLINEANSYRFSNSDTAIFLINKAIKLAKKEKLNYRFVSSYRIKGIFYIISSRLNEAITVYDSAIVYAEKYSYNDILIKIYINLGIVYTKKGDFDKAYFYYSKVLTDYENELDLGQKSVLFNNLGLMYTAKGDYISAMENHQMALYNRELTHDTMGIASSLMNIANIHFYQSDYFKAIDNYKKAVKVYDRKNYSYGSGQCYHNLGTIYEKIDSLALAEYYLEKALKYESAKTSRGRAKTLNMLGLVSMKGKKFGSAEAYFNESLTINRSINSKTQLIPSLNNLADLYNKIQQPNKSIKYSKEALELCKLTGSLAFEKDAYLNLSEAYEKKGDVIKSLKYFKQYAEIKDTILNKDKLHQIQELEIKYNSAKQEVILEKQGADLLKKNLEAKRKDAIIKKERIQKYALASIGFLILIILLIEVNNLRQKRKSALAMILKNEEINNQKIVEIIKKHQLESAKSRLEAQEIERNRIARELHDGIGGSLAAIKLYVDSIRRNYQILELDDVHSDINNTYKEVRALSHNLTSPEFEFDSIADIVKAYVSQISEHAKMKIVLSAKPNDDWNRLSESIQINIYRVAQELINNIIKHAKASLIEVDLELYENIISIKIKDNGVGFDVSKSSSGIGLKNIHKRVKEFNGKFEIKSIIGKGTEVRVEILDSTIV